MAKSPAKSKTAAKRTLGKSPITGKYILVPAAKSASISIDAARRAARQLASRQLASRKA